MKTLKTAAIIAFVAAGLLTQAQAQTYTQKFNAAQPELKKLMDSMQYSEAIQKIEGILPATIPAFEKDPANPQVGMNSYQELGNVQLFHEYLYRAYLMSGNKEKAVSTIKKAEEISTNNAKEIEIVLTPMINGWTEAIETAKKGMEENTPYKDEIESNIKELEAKAKKSKKEREQLTRLQEEMVVIEQNMGTWEDNLRKAPAAVAQLNGVVDEAKKDAAKFAQDIKDIQSDIDSEKELIDSKFDGNKAKYVAAAISNEKNYPSGQKEKVWYFNRLLFLDPQNTEVKKQLDIATGK